MDVAVDIPPTEWEQRAMEIQASRRRNVTDDGRLVIHVGDLTVIETRTTNWRAASARVGSLDPAGRRRLRGLSPQNRSVPQGEIHAYLPGSDVTACGQPLDGLHTWEDDPFSDRLLNRCHPCLDRTRAG